MKLGELEYNVVFSRFLNPNDTEDSAYLVGQPPPPEGSTYFGVFLEVQNKSEEAQTLADALTITDADDQTYDAIPSESLYAFPFGGEVESQEQIPVLDSTPQQGPIEGSLVALRAARHGLREPAADPRDPRPRRRRPKSSSTSSAGPPLEAGGEDFRGGRRGHFAARGFGFDQQHADRQLRLVGGGEGGEPGVLDLLGFF